MDDILLKDLNAEQKKAVVFDKGPLMILAGAGSGKTKALTYRVAYLIKERKINPDRILLATFTNKAAGEMKERVKQLIGKDNNLGFAGTFHSFCAMLLRREGKYIDIDPDFTIYDESDSLETIKQAMINLKINDKTYKPRAIKTIISQAKNEMIGALEYTQVARGYWQEAASKVYLEYQRLLKSYKALDFDDLLVEAVKLLIKESKVKEIYSQKFFYVLVDEYQDTNRAQYRLTKILASKWRNLCVVGDAAQSIYSWRGADYRNLMNLKNDFPDIKIINLEQNYRSTQNILKAANQIIAKNSLHPILKLWTKSELGSKIKAYEAKDEKDEIKFIIGKIKNSKNLGENAVLYRTNAQSRVAEEEFIKAGIAYVLIGGIRFYSRKEIKDCLAYLRYLINPHDKVSYQRLEKIGKRRLDNFLNWAEKYKKNKTKMTSLEILKNILKVTKYSEKYDEKNEQDLMRLENIKELKSVAREFPDLKLFLEKVALVEKTDWLAKQNKNNKEGQAVTLMTLHASKGLEFKRVFMIGMEEGLFPHSRSMLDKHELEEERRLCYVGMTRAKKELWFSYARRRLYFGRWNNNAVSRFLGDIETELLKR